MIFLVVINVLKLNNIHRQCSLKRISIIVLSKIRNQNAMIELEIAPIESEQLDYMAEKNWGRSKKRKMFSFRIRNALPHIII